MNVLLMKSEDYLIELSKGGRGPFLFEGIMVRFVWNMEEEECRLPNGLS